ncbi:MAG: PAS domain S-box protein, partial [Bacteroidetes bacterium]
MAGLKIRVCFWYLDPLVLSHVVSALKRGGFDPQSIHCKDRDGLRKQLETRSTDVIISDFDLPLDLREIVEQELEPFIAEIALIYLVGEKNESEAAESLKHGAWDYVLKGKLDRLVPTVYSFQRYYRAITERHLTEEALSVSRERYASIFNAVSDGILLIDFETRKIQEYNPRILEMFEITREDMEDVDLEKFSCLDEGYTLEKARNYIEEAVQWGTVTFEWRNNAKNGRRFWTLNSISIVHMNARPWILLVSRTIERQKRMEQSLLESQEHFRALAENSPDVIMRFDRDLRHVYLNGAIETQTGLKVEEFTGRSHREMGIFPEKKVVTWEKSLEKVFRTGKPQTIDFEIDLNGRHIYYEWRLYPETGSSESIQSVIGVARDVTESRKSELILKDSEERLNLALQATGLGLWDWNLVTNEVYFSPIWMSMLGYGPDELPQEFETWEILLHPDDRSQAISRVQASVDNRE